MKITQVAFTIGAFALSIHHLPLQAMELGPEMRMDDQPKAASTPSTPPGGGMCAKTEQVVFSCPLGHGKKVVSMCAAGDVAGGHGRFYYAYGRPGAPELVYPADGAHSDAPFTRTHLRFAGNTGGYAYTFDNKGYKYVVYSVSGERNQQDAGVMVKRAGETKAMTKMSCQAGKVTETDSDPVIDATLKWKSDSDIETNGLPVTR